MPVPLVPQGLARRAAITNHYYLELTPEQRMDPRWHPDHRLTWDAFFINRRERALARYEENGPPRSNFNEAGRQRWWGCVEASRLPQLGLPEVLLRELLDWIYTY